MNLFYALVTEALSKHQAELVHVGGFTWRQRHTLQRSELDIVFIMGLLRSAI